MSSATPDFDRRVTQLCLENDVPALQALLAETDLAILRRARDLCPKERLVAIELRITQLERFEARRMKRKGIPCPPARPARPAR